MDLNRVNVDNSIFDVGVTKTQTDDEVIYYLRSYGDLKKAFTVTDSGSPYYKNLIVEF